MVASRKTISDVRKIILRHLTEHQARALVSELSAVRGNASFEATVKILERLFEKEDGK